MEPFSDIDLRKMKRLDRHRHEEIERILSTIKLKEEELLSVRSRCDSDQTQGKMKVLRAKKEEVIAQRRRIDDQLLSLNKEVSNKRDVVAKIQSNLKYRKEDKIDAAIKRLEYQLQVNNFKVNEEKKIVQEIDSLKRSKRSLKEFNIQKEGLDEMRKSQNSMRSERDALYKRVTEIKAQEEKIKKEVADGTVKTDMLKQELDQLYGKKRAVIAEFQHAQHLKEEQRRQLVKKKQEDRLSLQEGKQKDGECSIVVIEPYLEERQLCATLLAYLQRFDRVYPVSCCTETPATLDVIDSPGHLSEGNMPSTTQFEQASMIIRKKGDDLLECLSKTRHRRLRKEKKKKQEKPVSHTLEIFEQFAKLNLQAPSTQLEIPVAIEQLKTKKKYYEHLNAQQPVGIDTDFPNYSLSDTTAPPACNIISKGARNFTKDYIADSTSYSCSSKTFDENPFLHDSSLLMPSHNSCNDVDNGNFSVTNFSNASSVLDVASPAIEVDCSKYRAAIDVFPFNSSAEDCLEHLNKSCDENRVVEEPEVSKSVYRERPVNLEFVPRVIDCIHSFQNSPSCKSLRSCCSSDDVSETCPFVNGH